MNKSQSIGSRVMSLRLASNCARVPFAELAGLTRTELESFELGLLTLPPEKAAEVEEIAENLELAATFHPTVTKISDVATARAVIAWFNKWIDRELAEWKKVTGRMRRGSTETPAPAQSAVPKPQPTADLTMASVRERLASITGDGLTFDALRAKLRAGTA